MGHVKVRFDEAKHWLVMERGPIKVMCNLGDEAAEFENEGQLKLLLASRADVRVESCIVLPPDTLAVVSCEKT